MSSGFITESEIAEARKRRQEEWDRVRQPDDPIERPEEPFDSRSLFDRLQEQKQRKDLEYEEAHKLKNMIKGLDDDEIEFLDLVDQRKLEADRKKEQEEEIELNDYRNRVASLQEKHFEERLHAAIDIANKSTNSRNSISQQKKLLKAGVVIKTKAGGDCNLKRKNSNEEKIEPEIQGKHQKLDNVSEKNPSQLKCVAILPGLGCYDESTSDDNSSDSETETPQSSIDILGRKMTPNSINKAKEN